MAGLALSGILFGVDKIPDKWFEKIPYYRSEEAKLEKKRSKKDRGRRRRSVDDHSRSDDERYSKRHERRRRSQGDYNSDDDEDEDNDHRRKDREYSRRNSESFRGQNGQGGENYTHTRPSRTYDPREAQGQPPFAAYSPRTPYSPHSPPPPPAGHNYAYSPTGVAPNTAGYHGYPEHSSRRGSTAYSEHRGSVSGPAGQGYVPYAHIYTKHGHRLSQSYSPTAYEGGSPPQDQVQEFRGRERGRKGSIAESFASDDSRRRVYVRQSRTHSRA